MASRPESKMKVLIGYDGSACAETAVRDLRRAGLPPVADAVILAVADLPVQVPFPDYGSPGVPAYSYPVVAEVRELTRAALDEAREAAARGGDLVASEFPGWAVRAEAVADSPYWALVKKADEWAADLVVVGSHGRSAVGRLYMGSVSQNVLHHAACSVRVGRCRDAAAVPDAAAPARIVLAVDGSPDSAAAAEAVAARRWPPGTEVRVVTAVDAKSLAALVGLGEWAGLAEHGRDSASIAQFRARSVAKALAEQGVSATPVVLDGDPKRAVVAEAERWGADCIFLGAKGHSRLERFLLGSVSSAVGARAHCSVEIVRSHGRAAR